MFEENSDIDPKNGIFPEWTPEIDEYEHNQRRVSADALARRWTSVIQDLSKEALWSIINVESDYMLKYGYINLNDHISVYRRPTGGLVRYFSESGKLKIGQRLVHVFQTRTFNRAVNQARAERLRVYLAYLEYPF